MEEQLLVASRRSLHGVAELVIAGPQFRSMGSIELRVRAGGIGGALSGVRIAPALGIAGVGAGAALVGPTGTVPLEGSCRTLAAALGHEVSDLADIYGEGSGVDPDETLTFDPDAVGLLLDWFGRGEAALRRFAPESEAVLWPEHFDVGIALDEVNYGASPGDSGIATPYAYVGPWEHREGDFWNASFGAARLASELDTVDAIVAFYEDGRRASIGSVQPDPEGG